jgi:cytochrome P450
MTAHQLRVPDLSDTGTFVEAVPFDVFDELRREPGLYWQPTDRSTQNGGFWAVTRYADILEIEKTPELFTSSRGCAYPSTNLPEGGFMQDHLMHLDPPRHSEMRRVTAGSFGPRVIVHFDSWIREIVVEVLDRIQELNEFDWVTEVAAIIPSLVVARVLGVPRHDRHIIVDLTNRIMIAQQQQTMDNPEESLVDVWNEMTDYITNNLINEKRANPQEDMATVITQAADRGDLSPAMAESYLLLLIAAGYETTHTMMGQTMRMMLEDPTVDADARRAIDELGADPVMEEFLRMVTPAMNMARTATRDTELGGQAIRSGDLMQMYFIAANRDPEVFEDPHRFNPWRKERKSLAFGSGVHKCLGNNLAKMEVRILLEEMSNRGIRLRLNGEPKRGQSVFINSLLSLPVAIVSADPAESPAS